MEMTDTSRSAVRLKAGPLQTGASGSVLLTAQPPSLYNPGGLVLHSEIDT